MPAGITGMSEWVNELHNSALVTWCMTNRYFMTVHTVDFKQVANKLGEWNFWIYTNIIPYISICFDWVSNSSHLPVIMLLSLPLVSQGSWESIVQRRKWSLTANDPQTRNDPQTGPKNDPEPEMIPDVDRKWSHRKTRIGMEFVLRVVDSISNYT